MNKDIQVSEIMTSDLIVADKSNTYSQIMTFFTARNVHHLPVAENGRLIGIISINDIARYLFDRISSGASVSLSSIDADFKVEQVMTPEPVTVAPGDDLDVVLNILAKGSFQSVPVVEGGIVTGIITNKDLVRAFKWQFDQE